jgi:hypothetical protein
MNETGSGSCPVTESSEIFCYTICPWNNSADVILSYFVLVLETRNKRTPLTFTPVLLCLSSRWGYFVSYRHTNIRFHTTLDRERLGIPNCVSNSSLQMIMSLIFAANITYFYWFRRLKWQSKIRRSKWSRIWTSCSNILYRCRRKYRNFSETCQKLRKKGNLST